MWCIVTAVLVTTFTFLTFTYACSDEESDETDIKGATKKNSKTIAMERDSIRQCPDLYMYNVMYL